ncbi:hypothetical protein RBA41_03725 [Massilia sp. CCM 9210]|uniref:hypothetical protein n=1 Tax=Massilia scottii TaxID=3057166 RepID=UPI002796D947|nr:hypothetical protein [Massilia sp. CCM 9210]MDQ1812405.1 hypothetical protein [Massilia sp. CCM 9210]
MSLQDLVGDRQHDRLLRLSFRNEDGPSSQLLVNRVEVSDALSRPFEFTVALLDDPNIALKELQGPMMWVEPIRRYGTRRSLGGPVNIN